MVRLRRGFRRNQRPARRVAPTARQPLSAADGDELRGDHVPRWLEEALRRSSPDDRTYGDFDAGAQGTRGLPLLRCMSPRLHNGFVLQQLELHIAGGDEDEATHD